VLDPSGEDALEDEERLLRREEAKRREHGDGLGSALAQLLNGVDVAADGDAQVHKLARPWHHSSPLDVDRIEAVELAANDEGLCSVEAAANPRKGSGKVLDRCTERGLVVGTEDRVIQLGQHRDARIPPPSRHRLDRVLGTQGPQHGP